MERIRGFSSLFLRPALGLSFLSALADRFGLWGAFGRPNVPWGSFARFVAYNAAEVAKFGVELGKVLAQRIIAELESKREPTLSHDSSSNNLIRRYRKLKEAS